MARIVVVEEAVHLIDTFFALLNINPPRFESFATVDLFVRLVFESPMPAQEADIEKVSCLVDALGHVNIFG